MTTRIVKLVCFATALLGVSASAQTTGTWDTTGNGMLKGQYYMREVLWLQGFLNGDLNDGAAIYGVVNFDGNGNYTFSGSLFEAAQGTVATAYTTSGTYSISASGYGFMDDLGLSNESILGLVSNGIFIGSSTENLSASGYNTLAIAAPIASPQASNATFKGTYSLVDLDSPSTFGQDARDTLITLTADGAGNLSGTTTASGYIAAVGGGATRQNLSGVKYAFSNGAGNIFFPGTFTVNNIDSTLIAGNHYVYISPDGNFVFGGSPTGWDMFIGVRNGTGAPSNFNGLYYQAGMDLDFSAAATNGVDLDSYFGSFKAGSGSILEHQRLLQIIYNNFAFDFTFQDTYTFNSDGSSDSTNTSQHYIYGLNGAVRIGIGVPPFLGISVALAAPTFSGPGVFLNPTGVVNSASFSLFTEQVAPGEQLTLYGTNLVSPDADATNPSYATTLKGTQVLINGVNAPIYSYQQLYGALTILVPYGTQGIADIQIINGAAKSNVVSVFVGATQPGIYAFSDKGVTHAIAQRFNDNYSLVTSANPAQPGDTLILYTTGLGAVTPSIADGAIANAQYNTANTINAYFGGVQAAVGFAGLTPGLVGLYQMNITVPTGLTPGDNILELVGVGVDSTGAAYEDTDNFETTIPIGSGSLGVNAVPQARATSVHAGMRRVRQPKAIFGTKHRIGEAPLRHDVPTGPRRP